MNETELETDRIEEIATAWAVRKREGLTSAQEEELQTWLDEDPRHFGAYAEADFSFSVLSPPLDDRQRLELGRRLADSRPQSRRWQFASLGLGLAAAAALVFALLPRSPFPPEDNGRVVARPLQQALPDGSLVQLNANARIEVDFSAATRSVKLLSGEAHFSVAKDPAKPFIVSVGPVKVRAVGTAFNVRYEPHAVEVLVTEGTVRVTEAPLPAPADPATGRAALLAPVRETDLSAGHRTLIALARPAELTVAPVSTADIQRELAWREMRFELSNATLEEAVDLFNRKGGVRLEIGDPALRSLRISGIYWANDPDLFADLISTTLGLNAHRVAADRILFTRP